MALWSQRRPSGIVTDKKPDVAFTAQNVVVLWVGLCLHSSSRSYLLNVLIIWQEQKAFLGTARVPI